MLIARVAAERQFYVFELCPMEILTKQNDDPQFVDLVKHVMGADVHHGMQGLRRKNSGEFCKPGGLQRIEFNRGSAANRSTGARIASQVDSTIGRLIARKARRRCP
jgi:hypothetical protein